MRHEVRMGLVGAIVVALATFATACDEESKRAEAESPASGSVEQEAESSGSEREQRAAANEEESSEKPASPKPVEGAGPMPELTALTLAEKDERTELKPEAKATLVNLWATWCAPCIAEMPLLMKVKERWEPKGLEMIGLSVESKKARDKIATFAGEHEVPFEIWFAPSDDALSAFGAGSVPASFLYDADGELVWSHGSMMEEGHLEELHAEIAAQLGDSDE